MHMPGHLREQFIETIEVKGPSGVSRRLIGRLWNCTDIVPGQVCDDLGIKCGSTYAQAVRSIRADRTGTSVNSFLERLHI